MGPYGSPITPMGLLWDHYGNGTKILASPMGVMGPGYGTKIFLVPWELARSMSNFIKDLTIKTNFEALII